MITVMFKGIQDAAHFLGALRVFLNLYRYGFYFSEDARIDEKGTHWGFFRFNQDRNGSYFDVDFSMDNEGNGYFHVHGDEIHVESNRCERKLVERLRTKVDAYQFQD